MSWQGSKEDWRRWQRTRNAVGRNLGIVGNKRKGVMPSQQERRKSSMAEYQIMKMKPVTMSVYKRNRREKLVSLSLYKRNSVEKPISMLV